MKRVKRSDYETLKANCAAAITRQLAIHNLTSSDVQRTTTEWALQQKEQYSISMSDLYHYRTCRTLPKGGKLGVLAKALQCPPEALVPKEYWTEKVRVQRRAGKPHPDGTASSSVTQLVDKPGYSQLSIEVVVPTEKAYSLAKQLLRLHSIEEMRRGGMSDEEIRGHMEAGEKFAREGHTHGQE